MHLKSLLKRSYSLKLFSIALLTALPLSALASVFTVSDILDNEVNVEVMHANGELLAIWLVDHDEERPQFENMLKAINQRGVEVWRVDLLADYFLPRSSENERTLSGEGVAALIREVARPRKEAG